MKTNLTDYIKLLHQQQEKCFSYYCGDKLVSRDEFYSIIGGRNCGKTEVIRRWNKYERRKEREKMGTKEDMREVKLNYLRDRDWVIELTPLEVNNLISDLYEQHDYLLDRLKHSEKERFKNG